MTDLELMRKIIGELSAVNVPAGLAQQIGVPIQRAIGELQALHNAVLDVVKQREAQKNEVDGNSVTPDAGGESVCDP